METEKPETDKNETNQLFTDFMPLLSYNKRFTSFKLSIASIIKETAKTLLTLFFDLFWVFVSL